MGRTPVYMLVLPGLALATSRPAPAQGVGFDWVTIGDPGNEPYLDDSPFGPPYAYGRGRVDYEYRMARREVTTGQWIQYVNTFSTQSDDFAFFSDPFFWGAEVDPTYQGPGRRWRLRSDVATPEELPVGGISWRESGMFCNWLHNGQSSDPASLLTGAYDTSTWGDDGQHFTDDPTHLPGARFWIPTLDEALKAMKYDPDRYGQGEGGWWLYPNMSDEPPVPGLPGDGTTTAGLDPFEVAVWDVPLGSYADQLSPWGLLDTTGGAREWTEGIIPPGERSERAIVGAQAGDFNYLVNDHVSAVQSLDPGAATIDEGLRIASAVPAPGAVWIVVGLSLGASGRAKPTPRMRPLSPRRAKHPTCHRYPGWLP